MKKKIRVGVVFGGKSAEHEVSLVSAQSVMNALNTEKYEVVPIGIAPDGRWLIGDNPMQQLKDGAVHTEVLSAFPGTEMHNDELALIAPDNTRQAIDVFFPVLHGTFGEDGTIQGLFEMLGVPYVGCGVLASALGIDKIMQKTVWTVHGLPLVKYLPVKSIEWKNNTKEVLARVVEGIGFPCFVKPSNLGSSVGVSKVKTENELSDAILTAFSYSTEILVEQGIDARELECSVLGNSDPKASVVGEVVPGSDFYDFADKYVDNRAQTIIPAKISDELSSRIRELAVKAYTALGCEGLARADFLVDKSSERIYINEVNTIPGFTSISMYPKLWEASGVPYPQLLDTLIELALERHHNKQQLRTSFSSESDWYKQ